MRVWLTTEPVYLIRDAFSHQSFFREPGSLDFSLWAMAGTSSDAGVGAIGVAPSPSLRSYTYVYPMGTVFSEVEEFIKVKRPSLIP